MSDTKDHEGAQDQAKGRLSLRPAGRLELGRTVDAGSVKQSFSHGRTKTVQVEVRKSRPGTTVPGRPAAATPPAVARAPATPATGTPAAQAATAPAAQAASGATGRAATPGTQQGASQGAGQAARPAGGAARSPAGGRALTARGQVRTCGATRVWTMRPGVGDGLLRVGLIRRDLRGLFAGQQVRRQR